MNALHRVLVPVCVLLAACALWIACGSDEPVAPEESPAVCVVRPDTVDFGFVTVGSSTHKTLEIENTGGGTLSGTVSVSGSEPCDGYSIVSGGGSYSLSAGQILTVIVALEPASMGEKTCRIATGSGCDDFILRGTAQVPTDCGVSPTAIDYGKVAVQSQRDTSFTITNTGGGVLAGTVAETCDYVTILSGGGPYSLGAGESRVVTVRFQPTVSGAFSCTIETGNDLCADVTVTGVTEFPRFTAWVTGHVGTILRTVDGGESWQRMTSGTTATLIDMAFADTSNGLICGVNGLILGTADGGETWAQRPSGTGESLVGLAYPDPTTAIAVGNNATLLRSTDGGASWAPQNPGVSVPLTDVSFVDADHGWIIGWDGVVMRTIDGGATWSPQDIGSDRILTAVTFVDLNNGIIITSSGSLTQQMTPQILSTSDGGATWVPKSPMASGAYNDAVLWSASDAIVAAANGVLYFTGDGGGTWQSGTSGLTNINGLGFANRNIGVAAGFGGNIIQTFDGGSTWVPRTTGTGAILRAVVVKGF